MGKYYNMALSEELERVLNVPYNYEEGPECSQCHHNDASKYTLTGNVIEDGDGVFVEKKCTECHTITDDGDGDFHQVYEMDKTLHLVSRKEENEA